MFPFLSIFLLALKFYKHTCSSNCLKAIGLTQTSSGSRKSATKLEKTERVSKKLSGKEGKQNRALVAEVSGE